MKPKPKSRSGRHKPGSRPDRSGERVKAKAAKQNSRDLVVKEASLQKAHARIQELEEEVQWERKRRLALEGEVELWRDTAARRKTTTLPSRLVT